MIQISSRVTACLLFTLLFITTLLYVPWSSSANENDGDTNLKDDAMQTELRKQEGPVLEIVVPPLFNYFTSTIGPSVGMFEKLNPNALRKEGTVIFNLLPPYPKEAVLVILYGALSQNSEAGQEYMPEVCATQTESLRVCDVEGQCRKSHPKSPPIILCNLKFILEMDAILRMVHNQEYLSSVIKSDRSFMDFLDRLHHDHNEIIEESSGRHINANHMGEHWLFLTAFVLAHELHHLTKGETYHSFQPGERAGYNKESGGREQLDLRTQILCRNFDEFKRQGWDFFPESDYTPMEKERLTALPNQEYLLKGSREIWKSEVNADTHAIEVVTEGFRLLKTAGIGSSEQVEQLAGHFAEALFFIALRSWYDRMNAFTEYPCGEFSNQDYILTRCLCDNLENYRSVGVFFDDTHPPLYLRIYRTLAILLVKGDLSTLTERTTNYFRAITALVDTAGKLALNSCMFPQIRPAMAEDGHIISDYSALEGFLVAEERFPGTPPSWVMKEIEKQCLDDEK